MEIAKLIAEFIGILIWPIVILIIVLLFKNQISKFLSNVKEAELPGGWKFKRQVQELENVVEASPDIKKKRISQKSITSENELPIITDPSIATVSIRLDIERQLRRFALITSAYSDNDIGVFELIELLYEDKILSKSTRNGLVEFIKIANEIMHTSSKDANDIFKTSLIGSTLLEHLKYIYNVQWLMHNMKRPEWSLNISRKGKYHTWSIIAHEVMNFDYSYEALCEAVTQRNSEERIRAKEMNRDSYIMEIPTLNEFIRILEFRRKELNRILHANWHEEEYKEGMYWQWPENWGKIEWNTHILSDSRKVELELFRTEKAIAIYRKKTNEI